MFAAACKHALLPCRSTLCARGPSRQQTAHGALPAACAAAAGARLIGTERVSLPPKPPPRRLVRLTTLCAGRPSTCATMFWFLAGPCASGQGPLFLVRVLIWSYPNPNQLLPGCSCPRRSTPPRTHTPHWRGGWRRCSQTLACACGPQRPARAVTAARAGPPQRHLPYQHDAAQPGCRQSPARITQQPSPAQ